MAKNKSLYTPMEVARILKISVAKFNEHVQDGYLPKGRLGEDGKRYYTQKDIEFIQRKWRSKTTTHFFMFTLPLLLVALFFLIAIFQEINQAITKRKDLTKPTPFIGFAAPPLSTNQPTPMEAFIPRPTPPKPVHEMYRRYKQRRRRRNREYYNDKQENRELNIE